MVTCQNCGASLDSDFGIVICSKCGFQNVFGSDDLVDSIVKPPPSEEIILESHQVEAGESPFGLDSAENFESNKVINEFGFQGNEAIHPNFQHPSESDGMGVDLVHSAPAGGQAETPGDFISTSEFQTDALDSETSMQSEDSDQVPLIQSLDETSDILDRSFEDEIESMGNSEAITSSPFSYRLVISEINLADEKEGVKRVLQRYHIDDKQIKWKLDQGLVEVTPVSAARLVKIMRALGGFDVEFSITQLGF